jgi:hypothetical protein
VSAVLCVGAGSIASGQSRFETLSHDAIPEVSGLQVVTVRDNALGACYVVFVMEPERTIGTVGHVEPPNLRAAAAALDARLADLSASFEQWRSEVPGTMAPNPLRYQWEATKAQHAFDLAAIQVAFDRLERRLDLLSDAPRLSATALPGPCASAHPARRPQ